MEQVSEMIYTCKEFKMLPTVFYIHNLIPSSL